MTIKRRVNLVNTLEEDLLVWRKLLSLRRMTKFIVTPHASLHERVFREWSPPRKACMKETW